MITTNPRLLGGIGGILACNLSPCQQAASYVEVKWWIPTQRESLVTLNPTKGWVKQGSGVDASCSAREGPQVRVLLLLAAMPDLG